jgi:hypothetical protein
MQPDFGRAEVALADSGPRRARSPHRGIAPSSKPNVAGGDVRGSFFVINGEYRAFAAFTPLANY